MLFANSWRLSLYMQVRPGFGYLKESTIYRATAKTNFSEKQGKIARFDLNSILKAKNGSQISPDLISSSVFSCKNRNSFGILNLSEVVGARCSKKKVQLVVEDMSTGAVRQVGADTTQTVQVVLATRNRLLVGFSNGTASQFWVGHDDRFGNLEKDYGYLAIGKFHSGETEGDLFVLGGWAYKFTVINGKDRSVRTGPVDSSVQSIKSLQVCRVENKLGRVLANSEFMLVVSGEGVLETANPNLFDISRLVSLSNKSEEQRTHETSGKGRCHQKQTNYFKNKLEKQQKEFESLIQEKNKIIKRLKKKCQKLSNKNILLERLGRERMNARVSYPRRADPGQQRRNSKSRRLISRLREETKNLQVRKEIKELLSLRKRVKLTYKKIKLIKKIENTEN